MNTNLVQSKRLGAKLLWGILFGVGASAVIPAAWLLLRMWWFAKDALEGL